MESLKNGKYVLESPWKVLEFLVPKRVRTLDFKRSTLLARWDSGYCSSSCFDIFWYEWFVSEETVLPQFKRYPFVRVMKGQYLIETSASFPLHCGNLTFSCRLVWFPQSGQVRYAAFSSSALLPRTKKQIRDQNLLYSGCMYKSLYLTGRL